MAKLYLVFSTRPNDGAWMPDFKLRAVYTKDHIASLKNILMGLAYKNVAENLNSAIIQKPEPMMKSWANDKERKSLLQELAIELKALRRETNEYRLAGDFDKFIETNAEISRKKLAYKQVKEYDEKLARYQKFIQKQNSANKTYEEHVQCEYEKLCNRLQIIEVETKCIYDENININIYKSKSGHVELIDFDDYLDLEKYPAFISLKASHEATNEKYVKYIEDAYKMYESNRKLLDLKKTSGIDVNSDDFKKAFKTTTDAFYQLKKYEQEYLDFMSKVPAQLKDVEIQFKINCYTISAQLNTHFSPNQSLHDTSYSIYDVRRFGKRVLLSDLV